MMESSDNKEVSVNLSPELTVKIIKQRLAAGNFSCNLWTFNWNDEKIGNVDELLTQEGVVHCWDELMDAFICFGSERDMRDFYTRLRVETSIEKLMEITKSGCNTPLINFFKD